MTRLLILAALIVAAVLVGSHLHHGTTSIMTVSTLR